MQTDCCTPQSVTSATIKSAVACGAACGDAGTHNVCAHRMSQSDDFVLITISFGRETSPWKAVAFLFRRRVVARWLRAAARRRREALA